VLQVCCICVAGAFQCIAAWERGCKRELVIALDYCVAGVSRVCCRYAADALQGCCRCVAGMLQVCCSVWQCVLVCRTQCVAVRCSEVQCVRACVYERAGESSRLLLVCCRCVAGVLQVCYRGVTGDVAGVLQVCCSVLQVCCRCVAACCSA